MSPASGPPAPHLTLYTRRDCHLCREAHELLERLRQEGALFSVEKVDVDGDEALRARFGLEVPVLCLGGRKIAKVRFDERRLRRALGLQPRS